MGSHSAVLRRHSTEWQERIPRFLFRGWKPASGGNSELNTTSGVTPHAFYGSDKEPHDKFISEIPTDKIKSEVNGHLVGRRVKSHFSSWAADLQTALFYAGVGKDAHLAIFDTSLRRQHNEIYHVPALHEIGLSSDLFAHEYLVFGPVESEAYTCVSVKQLRNHGMNMTVRCPSGTSEVTENDLIHAQKIAHMFRSIGGAICPDLLLTVCAAELSRLFHPSQGHDYSPGWSQRDNRMILTLLSDSMRAAARQPCRTSLVNPKTYVDGFPQLKAMVDILMTIELGVGRMKSEKSETSKESSSSTKSMPTASGQKRKADDSQVSTSKVGKTEPKKVLPYDLFEDLARHGSTFQEELQVTGEQLHSMDANAQALKVKLVATEKRMGALSINPKSEILTTAILHMEKAASDLDGLTKRTQDLTTELQHVKASLVVLQQSCNEVVESIGKEDDPFVHSGPQKPSHESPPRQPLGRTKPKATRVFETKKDAKRKKQKGM